jgi:hypothetical protein
MNHHLLTELSALRSSIKMPARAITLAVTAGSAFGLAASASGAVFTFVPTCAPFNWSSQCTQFNACGPGNTLAVNNNNWGSVVCGAPSVFPTSTDQVVFAGNGTIDIAPQVQRVTISPGVVVAFGAGYNATDSSVGFLNNGTLNSLGGNQNWTGSFQNNGAMTENSAGWTRSWNAVSFTNSGTINLPGSCNWSVSSGSNTLRNSTGGTISKTAGGTFSTNVAITNDASIQVTSGTFRLFSNRYTGNGGTITTSGSSEFLLQDATLAMSINGTSNSSIRTSGTLTIAGGPGATLNIGGNGLAINSNLAVASGLTNNNRVSTLAGDQVWAGGNLTNNGIWTEDHAGWTRAWQNLFFQNNGTINLPGSVNWSVSSGSNTLENSGTINKIDGGTFNTSIAVRNPSPGTIALAANGGTFRITGTSYSGSGQLLPQAGSEVLFNDVFFNGNGGFVTGTVPAGASIRTTGTITSSGLPATFQIGGQGITFNSNFGASSGFNNNGIARTAAGNQTWSASSIVNNGTWTEDSAGWTRFFEGVQFTNNGTLSLPGSVIWSPNAAAPAITNNATINKTAGGQFSTSVPITNANTGTISVAAGGGTFRVSNTAYNGSGQLTTQSGGEILFENVAFNGNSGVVTGNVAPGGSIRTTGTISSPGIGATFNVQGQGISFNGNFGGGTSFRNNGIARTLAGNQTWNTGTISNNGTWTEDGAGWSRSLVGTQFVNNGTLNLPGSVNWTVSSGGPSISNAGTINKSGTGNAALSLPVSNAGLIDISGGTMSPSSLSHSGSSARTLVRAGATLGGGPHTLSSGRLEGLGSVTSNFTNSGVTVSPGDAVLSAGALSFGGTYTQTASGTFEFSLVGRPNLPFDRIVASGNVTLGGTLRIVLNPPYLPTLGDVYEIVRSTSGTLSGTFSSVQVVGGGGVAVSVTYTSTAARLTITDTDCGSLDYNSDGLFPDDQDLIDFLSVLAGGACSNDPNCGAIDFNNDGLFPDDTDLFVFLQVLAGGNCD